MKTQRSTMAKWSLNAGLVVGLALIVLLVLVAPSQAGVAASTDATNAIANPGFENGVQSWTCRQCNLTSGAPAQSGSAAGQFVSTSRTARALLFQNSLTLQANTSYELTFWAKSEGKDLQVDLLRQTSPFTNYGMNETFDVTSQWQQFSTTFTTKGFNGEISNARIRFRAPKGKGFKYSLDDVSLVALGGPPPTTATPNPTRPSGGSEILVFDWNKPVTKAERGFPWDKPPTPIANSNWKLPPHYDQGVMHLRAEIKSARPPQIDMKVQFCIWQTTHNAENCTETIVLEDKAGDVAVFSEPVQQLWKKDGRIIEWSAPRTRNGIAIKTLAGKPVSDFSEWNWNGENPDDWYPMDARFTVVVTAPGTTFSGWGNYTD